MGNNNNTANDPGNGEIIGKNDENLTVVKIEDGEYSKVNKKSKFIGVTYNKDRSKWRAQRWNKNENKNTYNGCYEDEETAALASDTLARKFMENGGQNHKVNFSDDYFEVYPEKITATSEYIGVFYDKSKKKWKVQRWSKDENKRFCNGYYADEETAAHASDTLARKLIENGEQNHRLNFPEDQTKFHPEKKTSKYIGVSYRAPKWRAQRHSKDENKR